jgi:acyl carrier protein
MEHSPGTVAERAPSVAPRTPTERTVLEIWSAILRVDDIGVLDDFLDLGGDSLSATRCINRIRTAFAVDVPLDAFFAMPADIATIAGEVDRLRHQSQAPSDM